MESSYIDSRVVRTIRRLRKIQTNNDSFDTRTSTPSQDAQILEIISNCEEIQHILNTVDPLQVYEVIKKESNIVKDLLTEQALSSIQVKRIQERLADHEESVKIQDAKRMMSNKIQERMEAIRRQLAESEETS